MSSQDTRYFKIALSFAVLYVVYRYCQNMPADRKPRGPEAANWRQNVDRPDV